MATKKDKNKTELEYKYILILKNKEHDNYILPAYTVTLYSLELILEQIKRSGNNILDWVEEIFNMELKGEELNNYEIMAMDINFLKPIKINLSIDI